jgi:tRNA-specific adenosine deaminase 2
MAESGGREELFMRAALEEGRVALRNGEIPVGCVFVDSSSGEVVAKGSNRTNETKNGTSHAELVCIQDLMARGVWDKDKDLSTCELYVTCEPCIMCAAALSMLHIKAVYFGCHNDRFGGNGSILSVHDDGSTMGHHKYPVHSGVLKGEAIKLFQDFYSQENRRAPEGKRKRQGAKS